VPTQITSALMQICSGETYPYLRDILAKRLALKT